MAQDMTFAYFDAARTSGYVQTRTQKSNPATFNELPCGLTLFTEEEEDGDSISSNDVIRQLQKLSHPRDKSAIPQRPNQENNGQLANNRPMSREQIQLHRLLGDTMLTSKGDRIMRKLEELTLEDEEDNIAPNVVPAETNELDDQERQDDENVGDELDDQEQQNDEDIAHSADELAAMFENFEQYILDN